MHLDKNGSTETKYIYSSLSGCLYKIVKQEIVAVFWFKDFLIKIYGDHRSQCTKSFELYVPFAAKSVLTLLLRIVTDWFQFKKMGCVLNI